MNHKFFTVQASEFGRLVNSGVEAGYELVSFALGGDDSKVAALFVSDGDANSEADSAYWDSFAQTT